MDFKNNPIKAASLILGGLVLIIMFWTAVSTSGENKRLKRAVNDNDKKIEALEAQKVPLLSKIKTDSLEIIKKEALINSLKTEEQVLKNTINYLKNENKRLKNDYITSDIDERVAIFAKLANQKD